MLIDPENEPTFLLSEGRKLLPGAPGYHRLYRGAILGHRLPDGSRVKLETINMPDGLHTSVQAWYRWIKKINSAREAMA